MIRVNTNRSKVIRFNANTPLELYFESQEYEPGEGHESAWTKIGNEDRSVFYCEWTGSFGDRALSAEALGVKDSATLRMFYNPTIYAHLRTARVVIIKGLDASATIDNVPDRNNPNVYELWGGVDNVKEENQVMEFRVRRYEGK
jgi:hypothetical protein